MSGGIWFDIHDEEEYNALQSLKIFLEENDPYNPILPSFNFELWNSIEAKKQVSLEEMI